jgi:UDP-3-O-[3-hydroxymyristoyl] glucosamine N-acyltransferase
VFLKSNVAITGDTLMTGVLSVNNEVFMASNLTVDANAFFAGPVFKIPSGIEANRPLSNVAPPGSMYFNESTFRFEGLHDLGGSVQEWKPFGGVVDIDADTFITAETTTDDDTLAFHALDAVVPRMTMTSTFLSVNVDTVLNKTLSVSGLTVLNSTLSVGNVADFATSVRIGSRLSVVGETILGNSLSVNGTAFLSSNLSVFGNTQMEGTLSVKGIAYLSSDLSVQGNTDLIGTLTVTDEVVMSDNVGIVGNTVMTGTLSVNSDTNFASTVTITDATVMNGTLSVLSPVVFASSLSVNGETKIGGVLSVNDNVFLASNATVTGNSYMTGILSVNDDTFLNANVAIINNTTMGGSLSVTGTTTLDGSLSLGSHLELNSTLSVTGGVQLGNNLSVAGDMWINPGAANSLFVNRIQDHNGGVLTIDVETLVLNGNLDVLGTYNTLDINTSTISVEDKLIVLATSSDNTTVEDSLITNNYAGMEIAGVPSDTDITTANIPGYGAYGGSNLFEKSLKWNMNTGMQNIGYLHDDDTGRRDSEPFWELKGGALHLSADKIDDTGNKITVKYGLRINGNDELEIIKKVGNATSKRVAKFGITSAF